MLMPQNTNEEKKIGFMYLDYLRNHKRVTYSGLLLSGKLNEHIENIDRQAEEIVKSGQTQTILRCLNHTHLHLANPLFKQFLRIFETKKGAG